LNDLVGTEPSTISVFSWRSCIWGGGNRKRKEIYWGKKESKKGKINAGGVKIKAKNGAKTNIIFVAGRVMSKQNIDPLKRQKINSSAR
jgi:hypothetical protein